MTRRFHARSVKWPRSRKELGGAAIWSDSFCLFVEADPTKVGPADTDKLRRSPPSKAEGWDGLDVVWKLTPKRVVKEIQRISDGQKCGVGCGPSWLKNHSWPITMMLFHSHPPWKIQGDRWSGSMEWLFLSMDGSWPNQSGASWHRQTEAISTIKSWGVGLAGCSFKVDT